MNRKLTLGSLFDGIGGFPLAGKMAGITPVWASEIEPFPIRVTEKRLPEMKHYLRIQYDEEDAYLTSLIAQAQAAAEDYCRTQFSDPAPEPVRLAVLLMVGFYYENRDIPDMTTYKAMRMAFDSLLYPYRDPEKIF